MPKFLSDLTLSEGINLLLGTTTGSKIGTSSSQKLGFFNATPVAQQTGNIITALSNLGLVTSGTVPSDTLDAVLAAGNTSTRNASIGALTVTGGINATLSDFTNVDSISGRSASLSFSGAGLVAGSTMNFAGQQVNMYDGSGHDGQMFQLDGGWIQDNTTIIYQGSVFFGNLNTWNQILDNASYGFTSDDAGTLVLGDPEHVGNGTSLSLDDASKTVTFSTYNTIDCGSATVQTSVLTSGNFTLSSGNISTDTTTGTKIGTSTSQKIGFFNATPVAQQANTVSLETVLSNLGLRASGSSAPISVGNITIADASNLIIGTSTGTKIGTSTSQKVGFFNATPVIQQTGDIVTALSNLGLVTSGTVAASGFTGTLGVTHGGTGTATAFTAGSVVFAGTSGVYSQNNSILFWDNTNNFLGIGTNSPAGRLEVLFTDTSTSGTSIGIKVTPTYNQTSGTTSNTDLLVNRTETSVQTGTTQRLIDAQVGGTTKFNVDNHGVVQSNTPAQQIFQQIRFGGF